MHDVALGGAVMFDLTANGSGNVNALFGVYDVQTQATVSN